MNEISGECVADQGLDFERRLEEAPMRRQWLSAVAVAALLGLAASGCTQEAPSAQDKVYIDPDTGPGPDQLPCPEGQTCPDDQVTIDPDTGPGPEGQAPQ